MEQRISFYKEHYDVIVIGGALAGMSAALSLAKQGKSVLILERHNLQEAWRRVSSAAGWRWKRAFMR